MPIFLGIGVVGLVVVAALALIATRPAHFRIQRSAQIDALAMSSFRSSTTFTSGVSGRRMTSAIRT